jgi:ER degradation enhancer, mannosidase alpha-like 1
MCSILRQAAPCQHHGPSHSFFEYALKWYILSGTLLVILPIFLSYRTKFPGEVEYLDVWLEAYAAIMKYSRTPTGYSVRSIPTNQVSLSS